VFEVRDPAAEGWQAWSPEQSWRRVQTDGFGAVQASVELTEVALPLVSFRWTYHYEESGKVITSGSTLRFRTRKEVEQSLDATGYEVVDVRDAPDRPGLELVFLARRAS
jgi:hypothetical protein